MRYRMIKRRRRAALTDYRKRVSLLVGGMPRVVVRKSNRGISMQLVSFQPSGDRILTGASSGELRKLGWSPRSNIPTAYLTGLMFAQKAKGLNIGESVLDIGLYKPQKSSIVFAAARGAADGGMKIRNKIEFDEKRLRGGHIAEYAKLIKGNAETYKRQFSGYSEEKFDIEKLSDLFEETKRKIMGGN